jgi:hypothetical protein
MHSLDIWYLNENESQEAGVCQHALSDQTVPIIQCGSAAELAKSQILLIKITLYAT